MLNTQLNSVTAQARREYKVCTIAGISPEEAARYGIDQSDGIKVIVEVTNYHRITQVLATPIEALVDVTKKLAAFYRYRGVDLRVVHASINIPRESMNPHNPRKVSLVLEHYRDVPNQTPIVGLGLGNGI